MQQYTYHKSTKNSDVCIKGSWWTETESDYDGIFEEVIKLTHLGSNSVTLFKCRWFDIDNYMKVDSQYELIEIKHGLKAYINDPFVLAQQTIQVYYILFPSKDKRRKLRLMGCM